MARRSGLGRGLGALIPTDVAGERGIGAPGAAGRARSRRTRTSPARYFDEEALAALTASIRELGVLQPVLVRPVGDERYELIAGERRWRAAKRAGLQTIPALVRDGRRRRCRSSRRWSRTSTARTSTRSRRRPPTSS